MTDQQEALSIAIINYPGAQTAATCGMLDMFQVASRLYTEKYGEDKRLSAVQVNTDEIPPTETFSALILPPSLEDQPDNPQPDAWSQWMLEQHKHGAILCSVCSGAFHLAQTGVLNNRPATTHWGLAESFHQQYPLPQLNTDKLLIDDNDIITAGGMMAWTDLGLRLVERFLGCETMLAVSSFFLIDPNGREQRYYSEFSPSLSHQDKQIIKVQHWLQAHSNEELQGQRI